MSNPQAEQAWVRYRDEQTGQRDRRQLRKRDFIAGFEAATAPEEFYRMAEALRLAEDVAAVFGWTAVRDEGERDKAASLLWRRWAAVRGGGPKEFPHLTDEVLADLAREYDEHKAMMRRALSKIVVTEPVGR